MSATIEPLTYDVAAYLIERHAAGHTFVTARRAKKVLDCSGPHAGKSLSRLVDAGVLEIFDDTTRRRTIYRIPDDYPERLADCAYCPDEVDP